jgi:hypothetical protein
MLFDCFETNIVDKCIYIKKIKNDNVILYFYVDDIMIFSSNIQAINLLNLYYLKILI